MNNLIAGLIQSSKGYSHETVGVIIGFFDDPEQAYRCANKITELVGKTVEIYGSQISVS